MKLYWIVVSIIIIVLLLKLALDTGLWLAAGVGFLAGLSALSEFMQRFARAMEAMKGK